jgi:hypothetical protein
MPYLSEDCYFHLTVEGGILEDLAVLEENESNYVEGKSDVINFQKFFTLADKILEINRARATAYTYQALPVVRNYLIKSMTDIYDEAKLNHLCQVRIDILQMIHLAIGKSFTKTYYHSYKPFRFTKR